MAFPLMGNAARAFDPTPMRPPTCRVGFGVGLALLGIDRPYCGPIGVRLALLGVDRPYCGPTGVGLALLGVDWPYCGPTGVI